MEKASTKSKSISTKALTNVLADFIKIKNQIAKNKEKKMDIMGDVKDDTFIISRNFYNKLGHFDYGDLKDIKGIKVTVGKNVSNVKYVHIGQLNEKKEREGVGISVYESPKTLIKDNKVGARIEEGHWKDDSLYGLGRCILERRIQGTGEYRKNQLKIGTNYYDEDGNIKNIVKRQPWKD